MSYYPNQLNHNMKADKIYIKDYHKHIYRKSLSNKFSLYQQKIYKLVILSTDQLLKKIFYLIKLEGYFNRIKVFRIYNNNCQHFLIDLHLNPVIKSIQIIHYKKLIIPYGFVWKIFLEHLGQPKNYYLINKTMKVILLWYKSKGFLWVQAKLINQHITNCISLKIDEGLIKKIKFICESSSFINKKLADEMNLLIQQELKVYLGKVLNVYSLEKGIRVLKNRNCISSCNYKIVKYTNGVYILIKYSISDNQIIQYTNNSTRKKNSFMALQQLYIYSYYYINFYYSKYLHILTLLPDLSSYTKHASLLYNKKKPLIFANFRVGIYKLYIKTIIYRDDSSIKRLFFSDRYQILLSIIFRIEPNNISFLNTHLFNKLCLYYRLFKNVSYSLIRLNYNKDYIILSKIKTLYMNLGNLQFYFKVIRSYILKYFKGSYDLIIYANLYIKLYKNISNRLYNLMYLNQHLYIHYKNKIYLDSILSYLKKHIFTISINTDLFIGENRNSYLFSFNFNQINNVYLTFINRSNFEYNLSLTKYIGLYGFINSVIYKSINYNRIHLFSPIYSKIDDYIIYLDNYLGLGIQLNPLIKEIPPIRMEVAFDKKGYKMIHLYISYEYNNY
uniref:Hypothetical_protein n=1 Tax=Gelidium vagum TaxID=35171 RepID=A0A141SE00_GELVA|nr:hypothetical_protein [Gelidium vagum]AMK96518.1 hypothetical_protein [Gelidium vagum]